MKTQTSSNGLSLAKEDKACHEYKRKNGERLIVCYSDKRAKKEAYNRNREISLQ